MTPNDKSLLREIIIVLIIKIVLLIFIWHHLFEPQVVNVDSDTIAETLLTPSQGAPEQ